MTKNRTSALLVSFRDLLDGSGDLLQNVAQARQLLAQRIGALDCQRRASPDRTPHAIRRASYYRYRNQHYGLSIELYVHSCREFLAAEIGQTVCPFNVRLYFLHP